MFVRGARRSEEQVAATGKRQGATIPRAGNLEGVLDIKRWLANGNLVELPGRPIAALRSPLRTSTGQPARESPPPRKKGRCSGARLMILFLAGIVFFLGWFGPHPGSIAAGTSVQPGDHERAARPRQTSFTKARRPSSPAGGFHGQPSRDSDPRCSLYSHADQVVKRVSRSMAGVFNCILIDLRHHSASGGGRTVFGLQEVFDVRARPRISRFQGPGARGLVGCVSRRTQSRPAGVRASTTGNATTGARFWIKQHWRLPSEVNVLEEK